MDFGKVKLVVMTNIFFNNQQREIKTRQFIWVKQIKSNFFSNKGNQLLFIVYLKRENRPLQKTRFSVKTGGYVKEFFFVNLQVGISQLHFELTTSQIIFKDFK